MIFAPITRSDMPFPLFINSRRKLVVSSLVLAATLVACKKEEVATLEILTVPVSRQTIVLDATASGAIEPINVIEVKSKSSGMIEKMPVETGTEVRTGDLLVQLETRDVQNQYDQAKADLNAAEARLAVSEAQKKRNDELFRQRIITAQEQEAAQLDYANAQAQIIRTRTSLDLAQQRLDDATVRAPTGGTVIEKIVSLGQVITSATNSANGGTTILKMADLGRVRMRALFNETDIGSVRPGLPTTVTVDAYPDRPFRGTVEKIEPQAVVQQSVTMFPVLVTLDNQANLLKPGMNGEASVLVEQKENVLALPIDAVRTAREAPLLASSMGLDQDSVQASITAQMASMGGGFNGGRQGQQERGLPSVEPPRGPRMMGGEVDLPQAPQVQASAEDCAKYTAALAAKPNVQKQLQDLREKMSTGAIDLNAMREQSQKIYAELGVDASVARACARQSGGGAGGPGGFGGARRGGPNQGGNGAQGANGAPAATQNRAAGGQGAPRSASPMPQGEFPARTRARTGVVFVAKDGTYEPRVVRLGIANFDYTEVLSGVEEGDQIAMLGAAAMMAAREASNARMRTMTGGGLPGMQKNTPAAPQGGGGPPRP